MIDHELLEIRRALIRMVRGRGKRYPTAIRERVAAWARRRQREGQEIGALAAEVRIHPDTLRGWVADGTGASLLAVEVTPEPDAATESSALVLISPCGFRVEGLSVEDAARLLRVLG